MIKYNTNDELFKKLEVSNFINTTVISENPYIIGGISETPILWGGTPSLPPWGGSYHNQVNLWAPLTLLRYQFSTIYHLKGIFIHKYAFSLKTAFRKPKKAFYGKTTHLRKKSHIDDPPFYGHFTYWVPLKTTYCEYIRPKKRFWFFSVSRIMRQDEKSVFWWWGGGFFEDTKKSF